VRITKNNIDGCNIYQIGERGYGYNRSLREWELYEMGSDGSIQDLNDRVKTRSEAERWANENRTNNRGILEQVNCPAQ